MNELVFWSATELARAIRSKHVSVQEVIDGHLRRITAINPALNAVVQLTGDQACEQARAADQAIARRRDIGPLHGVPVTVKDTFVTQPASFQQRAQAVEHGTFPLKTRQLSNVLSMRAPLCWVRQMCPS